MMALKIQAPFSASITISNTAPEEPLISVTADPVEQIDDVICSVDVASFDIDSDTVTYSFSWMVDGNPFGGSSSDTATNSTISALETLTGEVWTCTVTPNDGDTDGVSAVTSTTVDSDWLGLREFNNCGASGRSGPSQGNCDSSYSSSTLAGEVSVSSGYQYWTVPSDGTYLWKQPEHERLQVDEVLI